VQAVLNNHAAFLTPKKVKTPFSVNKFRQYNHFLIKLTLLFANTLKYVYNRTVELRVRSIK
jgi:hypothetical protein